MMNYDELYLQIRKKKSFLCIGLDTDIDKLPLSALHLSEPQYTFNKQIIDATAPYAVSYKINTAFYECRGASGWKEFEQTVDYIRSRYPDIFIIADAKRGDIGNTSEKYAQAFFNHIPCDAVTVNPYMGRDSVLPFLSFPGKWVILLGVTSNSGSSDFQMESLKNGRFLYQQIIQQSMDWADHEKIMYVAGATRPELLADIRKIIPKHFLLIPGVGAQGGNLEQVAHYAFNDHCGLLVNSSRDILFADNTSKYAEAAAEKARMIVSQMTKIITEKNL